MTLKSGVATIAMATPRGINLPYDATRMEFYSYMRGPIMGRLYRIEGRNGYNGYYDFWIVSDWSPPLKWICPKNPDNCLQMAGHLSFDLGMDAAREYIRILDRVEWHDALAKKFGKRHGCCIACRIVARSSL